ncbi:MAG: pyrimidine 5'-nucleotidase [Rhodospirillales bacterium]|nr:pyrimidine 5'-nucleotidase [Alphaproteobacteria bacterium]MBL6948668.1 pyrimidine 5'-nucleotidase [Rhodospirillales bacterium]
MKQTQASQDRLKQAECWVFDLDNTLYPASCDLFAQVDRKMTAYIADYLDVGFEQAGEIRKTYYHDHGTTMSGMMTLHDMDPAEFLDVVHDIDLGVVDPDPELDQALSRLPGRKIIFTNGPTDHARRVLGRLSIDHHFEGIFDIIGADYIPKPKPGPYDVLVERYQLEPTQTVMVEDLVRNLKPAAALGMTTVWVRSESALNTEEPEDDSVHHIVDDLPRWLSALTAG